MDNNNTVPNDIALDPNKMAPTDSSPLVQTSPINPVVDITPKDDTTVASVTPSVTSPAAAPSTPSDQIQIPSGDANPLHEVQVTQPTPTPSMPLTTPVVEQSVSPTPTPTPTPSMPLTAPIIEQPSMGGSLADIVAATAPVQSPTSSTQALPEPVTPTTTNTSQASPTPSQPVSAPNPLAEDPNQVTTIS